MGSKRAVLWDMDGVLVDSGELHFQSWMQTLIPLGIPFDREKFSSTFGMNNNGILALLLGKPPEADFLQIVSDQKEGLFREMLPAQLELLPGALHWLDWLSQAGFQQAVASSAPCENIEAIVDELEIRAYFSALISAYSMPGKPDPAVFIEAANQLRVPPSDCVVIEDSIAGISAARNGGMKCIAVTTSHPRSLLSDADIVVESLEELGPDDFN